MSPAPLCKNCGGGLPQHQEGPCWCKTCLDKPAAERCREYVPRPPQSTQKTEEGFGKKPPKPPKKAPKSMSATGETDEQEEGPALPSPGTPERKVLDAIRNLGEKGGTDAEVALKVDLTHGEVTALRSVLATSGLLWDSGVRRRDSRGHENVAWATAPADASPEADNAPLLVREDVYIEHAGRATTLHAGQTAIRLTGVPGDLVEVRTTPRGSDPEQDGGGESTLLLVIEGSEEVYETLKNPFTTPSDILEAMRDLVTPATNTLTGIRKDL